jgi:hypothetical protein
VAPPRPTKHAITIASSSSGPARFVKSEKVSQDD